MRFVRLLVLVGVCLGAVLTSLFHISLSNEKQYRFLLMMSSFKRPIFASGQVLRLMRQTYQNFDLSVSLKGVDAKYAALTFEKEFYRHIQNGRLFLRYDENGDQLSNLLDTIRDIDINKYDYFCKIDDDDWYAPEYLENINNELNDAVSAGKDVAATNTLNTYVVWDELDSTVMRYNGSDLSGPTMCFSRQMMRIALDIEARPWIYHKWLPDEPSGLQVAREDRMLAHLAAYWGDVWERYTSEPLVMYGQQYRSVIRNHNYVNYALQEKNKRQRRAK